MPDEGTTQEVEQQPNGILMSRHNEDGPSPDDDVKLIDPDDPEVAFSWQASEFVHNHKSVGWYALLALVVIVLTSLAVWLHLWLEIGLFIAMGVAIVVYARKPPRTLTYELSDQGVHIDGKLFPYLDFRSFGVLPDVTWHAIDLEPAKRFSIRTVLLFNTEDYEMIVSHLELHLPREDRDLDIIERITRYVRF